jgi:hypothetical protein
MLTDRSSTYNLKILAKVLLSDEDSCLCLALSQITIDEEVDKLW